MLVEYNKRVGRPSIILLIITVIQAIKYFVSFGFVTGPFIGWWLLYMCNLFVILILVLASPHNESDEIDRKCTIILLVCCAIYNIVLYTSGIIIIVSAKSNYIIPMIIVISIDLISAVILVCNYRCRKLAVEKAQESLLCNITVEYDSKESEACAICLEEFVAKSGVVEFSCRHIYHKKCAQQMIKFNDKCAICRAKLEWSGNNESSQV